MQTFKAQTSTRIQGELKSWGITIFVALVAYLALNEFKLNDRLMWSVIAAISLVKLGNTLGQYVISEIHIDQISDRVTFILKSILSGQKTRVFILGEMQSKLISNSNLRNTWFSSTSLNISTRRGDHIRLTNRYGFPEKTLKDIDRVIATFRDAL